MSTEKQIDKLQLQLAELESHLSKPAAKNGSISNADTHWQVEHAATVMQLVLTAFLNSKDINCKSKFGIWKLLIMKTGWIPRGKAKAPKKAHFEICETPAIKSKITQAGSLLSEVIKTDSGLCFKHPTFGALDKKETLRFLWIHTNHHLKIIRDILE